MKKRFLLIFVTLLIVLLTSTQLVLADTSTSSSTTSQDSTTPTTTAQSTTSSTADTTSQTDTVVNSDGTVVSPGTLPDSPFYWLSNLIQKLELALAFDPAKKASLAEQQALQALAGAQKMQTDGKADAAQKALNNYSDKITQAQQFLTQLKDPNSTAAKDLEAALAQSNAKNITVLSNLLDKVPPQAAQRIALNIVRSMEKTLAKYNKDQAKDEVIKSLKHKASTADQEGIEQDPATTSDNTANLNSNSKGEQHKSSTAKQNEQGQKGSAERSQNANQQSSQPGQNGIANQQNGKGRK